MRIAKHVGVAAVLLLLSVMAFSQQLRLGKNPYALQKSAILELESDNQGLLFPRITDTTLINGLFPPDGMVIFYQPSAQLMVRVNGYWQSLAGENALGNYWSVNGNINGVRKRIGSIDNYSLSFITNNEERMLIDSLGNVVIGNSSLDLSNPEKFLLDAGNTSSYNLFSAKGSIDNYLQLNIQNRSGGATASSDLVATADNGTENANFVDLGMNSSGFTNSTYPILSGANNAYLYSTGNDFIIGNAIANKNLRFFTGGYATANERLRIDGNGLVGIGITSPTAVLHLKAGTATANSAPLKFTSGALMTTAAAGAIEFLTDKFYGTITTGAARKELTLNDAALTAGRIPVTTTNGRLTSNANLAWNNTTSALGIKQVTPTANLHLGAGTAAVNTAPLKFSSGVNLTTPEDGAVEYNGTHFYATVGTTRFQLDQQTGTTYTGSNGITLSGNDFRNNLITGLAGGQTVTGGTASGNALTLTSTNHATKGNIIFGTSVYDEVNNRLGIGNATPSEKLDITGNLKFSGALMPNNTAGTSGYLLRSNGSGAAPTWVNPLLSGLSDVAITSPANGQILQYNGTSWINQTPAYLTSIDTTNISNFHLKVRSLLSAGSGISYNNATGAITNTGIISLNGNTGALTLDTNYISNFYLKSRSLLSAGTGISYNATTGVIASSINTGNFWNISGNAATNPASHFLGTTDDKQLIFKSNNNSYLEMGSRQTLGLVQGYTDYTDGTEKVTHIKSALQFEAGAALYKPKLFVDASGNFRVKGSSAGTDYFEYGATGTNNDGGFEFIIGDDGDEPILFKSYNYLTGTSEMMRLQSGRMAVGSNAFNATNPEKLLIDAGVTDSYNLMTGKGTINNYLQINVQNRSTGSNASSDLVATADNGDENVNFIDMGINSSGFSNTTYPILGGINNAYLYSTGNDFVIGNATAAKNLRFFTGGFTAANERLRIDGTGKLGIGTTTPGSLLHVKTGVTDQSGLRLENLTSSSATTSGAAVLGVDASGNVVRAKAPVYYSGGIGGSATVDGITKIWVAEVTNTATGIQTITIPANVAFTSIIAITLTAKGGSDPTNSPVAIVTSNTTSSIVIRVLESKNTGVLIGGNVEGLEAHTSTSSKIYIRVEGN